MSRIRRIEARPLEIAFKQSFAHASATRSTTQSLWVEATDEQGRRGCGEGCPREYVTGETLAGALAFVAARADECCARLHDVATLRSWLAERRYDVDGNPAAWCAIELALLDLFGRRADVPLEKLLGLPEMSGEFRYTAVIGDASGERFRAELARYLAAGFGVFKIKLSGDPRRDADKIAAMRAAGIDAAQVRADANNLWQDAETAIAALRALAFPFAALEEPLRAGDFRGLGRIAADLGCAIVLDESSTRAEQIAALPRGTNWIVNLRVSKMGGILRSLEVADRARAAGMPIVVGAHVGETSLLTRAGLLVASAHRDHLYAQEGAFGTHLLVEDVVASPIMFGAGGVLRADALALEAGLGLAYAW